MCFIDVKKQAQMAALTKERDNIVSVIRTYKNLFDTTRQLISELKRRYNYTALQRQTAVTAYLKSKQLLLFAIAHTIRWCIVFNRSKNLYNTTR